MRIEGLPKDDNGLTLEHNPNKEVYLSVAKYLEGADFYEWESDKHRQRAIDTDEIWVLRWYSAGVPDYIRIAAPTLEELCQLTRKRSKALHIET